MNPYHYQMFGPGHLTSIALLFAAGIIIIYLGTKLVTEKRIKQFAILLSLCLVIPEIPDLLYRTFFLLEPVKDNLPLHLCGVSLYITAFALVLKKQILFEIAYFWGLGGAIMAILSPGDIFYFPHILNIIFYTSHGLIIIGVLFMVIVLKFRPTFSSLFRVCVINIAYVFLIYPLNILLDTNYLFLRFKPKGATLINHMGPWPVYVIAMLALGFAFYLILYIPFLTKDISGKIKKREIAAEVL